MPVPHDLYLVRMASSLRKLLLRAPALGPGLGSGLQACARRKCSLMAGIFKSASPSLVPSPSYVIVEEGRSEGWTTAITNW